METNKVIKQCTVFMSARKQFSGIVLGRRPNYGLECINFLIIWFCVFSSSGSSTSVFTSYLRVCPGMCACVYYLLC